MLAYILLQTGLDYESLLGSAVKKFLVPTNALILFWLNSFV